MNKEVKERLRLMTEAIAKQLQDAGKDIRDTIPEAEKLLEAIKKVYPKRYKKSRNEKNVPDKVQ
jgi:hypothetical protein